MSRHRPWTYIPNGFSEEDSKRMFDTLWNDLAWVDQDGVPRREYWTNCFNKPYTYGRGRGIRTYEPQPSHPVIDDIRRYIAHDSITGVTYEGCFLNGYRDGRDALGYHADDDPGINHNHGIVVVTLYDGPVNTAKMVVHKNQSQPMPRSIMMRAIDNLEDISKVELGQGSILIMEAGMQDTHHHRIPKAGFKTRPRISLTFRSLVVD